jgi:hypothetical protein
MRLHTVDNPLLEVVKHGDLDGMEEFGLREVGHNTWNMLNHAKSSVHKAGRQFGLRCLAVGIAEHSISVMSPPGVLVFKKHILLKFVLWTLGLKTDMLLEMI